MQTPDEYYWEGAIGTGVQNLEFGMAATSVEVHNDGAGDIRVNTKGGDVTQLNMKLKSGEILVMDGGAQGFRTRISMVSVTGQSATDVRVLAIR